MHTSRLLTLVALLTVAAQASAQGSDPAKPATPATPAAPAAGAPAAEVNPVGSYVVNLTAQGNPIALTAKIEKKSDGTFAGVVMSDVFPPMPITSVKVAGAKITMTITAPDGSEATITMELKGDDITGDWSMPNDGSRIVGKKLP
ncbi:MAG: hypothetical protein NTU67_02670 [Gemmatimonadetes bacterium]|nr:hypothetical protein [Gemmatimonadota bacterium]